MKDKELEKRIDSVLENNNLSPQSIDTINELVAYAEELEDKLALKEFMEVNGLGDNDMINDIKYPVD